MLRKKERTNKVYPPPVRREHRNIGRVKVRHLLEEVGVVEAIFLEESDGRVLSVRVWFVTD